jgi:hypothetical protein
MVNHRSFFNVNNQPKKLNIATLNIKKIFILAKFAKIITL